MCRFLIVKSKTQVKPEKFLHEFALICQKSKTLDGDWQGDGWGIAWLDNKNYWQLKKSLSPVWENVNSFGQFPQSRLFVVHARSSSFAKDKGILAYNQPYIDEQYAFVFNGLLKGVFMPRIKGEIGAEKIWSLLKQELKTNKPDLALEKTKKLLLKNSKQIVALNIGLASLQEVKIYWLCYFTKYPKYYQLQSFKNQSLEIVCSESLV